MADGLSVVVYSVVVGRVNTVAGVVVTCPK